MEADSVPVRSPPISEDADQLGLKVKSTPNVVSENHRINKPTLSQRAASRRQIAARPKPDMAGNLRESSTARAGTTHPR